MTDNLVKSSPLSSQDVECPESNCTYSSRPSNVRRHLQSKHNFDNQKIVEFNEMLKAMKAKISGTDLYRCSVCSHFCTSKKGLLNHQREKHKLVDDPGNISLFGESSENAGSSYQKGHQMEDKSKFNDLKISKTREIERTVLKETGLIGCSVEGCNEKMRTREDFCLHLNKDHEGEYSIINEKFGSEPEYQAWKSEKQRQTCTSLKIRDSEKDGSRTTMYYVCHHEGTYERTGEKRHGHDTKKITGQNLCTCFLKVLNRNGVLEVTGCFDHRGHDLNYALQKLTNDELGIIRRLMEEGFNDRQIMAKLEKQFSDCDRLWFVTSDDLRFIRRTEGLIEGRFDQNDLESVKKRIAMKTQSDGVRFFKEPVNEHGDEFKLIIITPNQLDMMKKYSRRGVTIDDTHNSTKYHLKLTTMIVLDELDRGYPVGYMLSASTTSEDVADFFHCIKKIFPDFEPQFFMSDEAAVFWNGFKIVFPDSHSTKVVCRWHVYRAWKKNTEKHLKSDPCFKKILVDLREFLYECNLSTLRCRINTLLDFLENKDEINENTRKNRKLFADYMRTYNIGKIEEWAVPFREGTPFNTSMFSESWHGILKKHLLYRKTNVRIDELFHTLLEAFDYVINKNHRQEQRKLSRACPRRIETRKRCRTAKMQRDQYMVVPAEDGTYRVTNRNSSLENEYIVFDSFLCQCDEELNVHCDCGSCPYRFSCTCPDNRAGVSCKHVHMVFATIREDATMEKIYYEDGNLQEGEVDFDVPFASINLVKKNSRQVVREVQMGKSENEERSEKNQKLYQKLLNCSSLLHTHIRGVVKKNEVDSTSIIESAIESLMKHLPDVSTSSSLPIRAESLTGRKQPTCRDTMNKAFLKPRKRQLPDRLDTSQKRTVLNKEIEICDICHLADPPLPDDIDDQEEESRITLWKRCEKCHLVVHLSCSIAQKECLAKCGGFYVCYQPDDGLTSSDDEE